MNWDLRADRRRTLRVVAGLAVGLAVSAPALAQASAGSDPFAGLVAALNVLDAALARVANGVTAFNALGLRIAGVLFGIVLVMSSFKNWITGKGLMGLIGDLVPPLILFGATVFAINSNFGKTVDTSMTSLATAVAATAGANPPTSGQMSTELMRSIMGSAIGLIMDSDAQAEQTSKSNWKFWELPGMTGAFLLSVVARIFAALMLAITAAVCGGVILAAKFGVTIGLVMAPVMLPWGMWRPMSFLMTGWLKYMIVYGMHVVVAALMATVVIQVADSLSASLVQAGSSWEKAYTSLGAIVVSALMLYLMTKAPSIANALVTGSPNFELTGWGGAANAATKAKNQVAGAGGALLGGGGGNTQPPPPPAPPTPSAGGGGGGPIPAGSGAKTLAGGGGGGGGGGGAGGGGSGPGGAGGGGAAGGPVPTPGMPAAVQAAKTATVASPPVPTPQAQSTLGPGAATPITSVAAQPTTANPAGGASAGVATAVGVARDAVQGLGPGAVPSASAAVAAVAAAQASAAPAPAPAVAAAPADVAAAPMVPNPPSAAPAPPPNGGNKGTG